MILMKHPRLFLLFQSLNRAYKRSDDMSAYLIQEVRSVSIPQSGLQAFRRSRFSTWQQGAIVFQSLNRAYKRSDTPACGLFVACSISFNPSIGLTSVPTTQRDKKKSGP